MTKEEAKSLSDIFGSDDFKFGGIPSDLTVKIVKVQIALAPAAKELKEAVELAVKSLMTPRLKELNEKAQGGKLTTGTAEAAEFIELRQSFDEKFNKALADANKAQVDIELPTFSQEDFKELCKANSFTGNKPMTIYKLLVK